MITYSRIIPTADCMDDFNKLCRHVESYTQEQIDYIKSKSWCGVNDKLVTAQGLHDQLQQFTDEVGFVYYLHIYNLSFNEYDSCIRRFACHVRKKNYLAFEIADYERAIANLGKAQSKEYKPPAFKLKAVYIGDKNDSK